MWRAPRPLADFSRASSTASPSWNLEEGEGRSLTALDVLNRARERIETSLDTDPTVRLELLNILGASLMSLGETATAETVTARAMLEEARRHLGDDGFEPNDAEILIGLGRARLGQGRPSEALTSLEEADRFWRDFDPENRWAGEASLWLSDCYAALGRRRASEEARERAVAILSGSPDPAAPRLLRLARRPAGS